MGMPGGMEWVLIAFVVLLLFGGKKIPELAKGLGKGIKDFKGAIKEDEPEVNMTTNDKKIEEEKAANTATTSTNSETKTTV